MVSSNLKHINDVKVSVNELQTRMSLNRNFQKLLENDKYLTEKYNIQIDGLDIGSYVNGAAYSYGDLVWYRKDTETTQFYLLKCIFDGNSVDPGKALDDLRNGLPNFEKYGWKNQNYKLDLKEIGADSLILEFIDDKLAQHQNNSIFHRFGKMTTSDVESDDHVDKKLLKTDLSNINPNREHVFFPYKSGHFTTDSILNGIYRIYDNGLVEMSICFRLGFSGVMDDKTKTNILTTNNVSFRTSSSQNKYSLDYQENEKYFNSAEDMRIFNHTSEDGQCKIGNTLQINRNDYVNVYFAELDFSKAITFMNTDYMIFSSDTMSQKRTSFDNVNPGTNSMVFCNKKRGSITAIYITTKNSIDNSIDNNFKTKNGLIANTFSCNLIGRYK